MPVYLMPSTHSCLVEGVSHAQVGCYLGAGVQDSVAPPYNNGTSVSEETGGVLETLLFSRLHTVRSYRFITSLMTELM